MRETRFIEQNQEKWTEFENLLESNKKDPDKLSDLFIQITDDLSYSRTFYPNRSVRVYLNGLAQQLFYSIYKNRKGRFKRFINFWKIELPQVVYDSRRAFLISFVVFAISMAIGVISSYMDPDFSRVILGDSYVSMTEANIQSGDPMQVYKEMNEVDMFFGITLNNLRVDFLTFIFGLFFGIGAIGIMIYNGIMVGTFQYFFIERDLFQESFLTIWTHGTLEISAIIISGAAGIALGSGLAFPGTYSRLQAFQLSARRGIKILMGVIPLTILAGFFEGFMTRHTETPDFLRLIFILLCLTFVIGYFVIYPYLLAKRGFKGDLKDIKLPPDRNEKPSYHKIKNAGEIYQDTFTLYRKYAKILIPIALLTSAIYAGFTYFLMPERFLIPFSDYSSWSIDKVTSYFDYGAYPILFGLNIIAFSITSFILCYILNREYGNPSVTERIAFSRKDLWAFFKANPMYTFLIVAIANILFFIGKDAGFLLFMFCFPAVALWLFVAHKEDKGLFSSLGKTFSIITGSFGRFFVVNAILGVIAMILFVFIDSPFLWFYYEVLQWNFVMEETTIIKSVALFSTFITVFALNLIFPMIVIGMSYMYYTMDEIRNAGNLKERVQQIGVRKRVFGLEKEI